MPDEKQKEICTIRIMFPVMSDEQAIDCKKKIAAVLSEVPEVQIHFNLMAMPLNPPDIRNLQAR